MRHDFCETTHYTVSCLKKGQCKTMEKIVARTILIYIKIYIYGKVLHQI